MANQKRLSAVRKWESRKSISLGIPRGNDFKLGLFVATLQALSTLALMATSAWLISRAAEQPPVMYLMIAVVGVRGFALGRATFRYVERLLLHNAAFRMLGELRPRVFAKLIPLAPAGLGANRADTVTRLVNDVDEAQNLSLRLIAPILQSLVVAISSVAFFWTIIPQAAMWLLGCILVSVFLALPLGNVLARRANADSASHRSKFNQATASLIEHIEVLESFGWLDAKRAEVEAAQRELARSSRLQALAAGVGQSLFLVMATAATGGTAYFAATRVEQGTLPGVMLAVFALVPLAIFDTFTGLQPIAGVWQRYRAGTNRVVELFEQQPDPLVLETGGEIAISGFTGLRLDGISARYPGSSAPAASGVSFELKPGENLLVTGQSGAGKSTIANVLLGFLNPTDGDYSINGVARSQADARSLRRVIGYQEQSPTIFMGTLRTNLVLAKPDASDEELWAVLERVRLAETFRNRQGLETQLGELGSAISGGEAQRVALARSILADFKVVIFDEPTANVDPETARELVSDLVAIAKSDRSRASVFISHDTFFDDLAVDRRLSLG